MSSTVSGSMTGIIHKGFGGKMVTLGRVELLVLSLKGCCPTR